MTPPSYGWCKSSDWSRRRRTHRIDPYRPVMLLHSQRPLGATSSKVCFSEAVVHDHQEPATSRPCFPPGRTDEWQVSGDVSGAVFDSTRPLPVIQAPQKSRRQRRVSRYCRRSLRSFSAVKPPERSPDDSVERSSIECLSVVCRSSERPCTADPLRAAPTRRSVEVAPRLTCMPRNGAAVGGPAAHRSICLGWPPLAGRFLWRVAPSIQIDPATTKEALRAIEFAS